MNMVNGMQMRNQFDFLDDFVVGIDGNHLMPSISIISPRADVSILPYLFDARLISGPFSDSTTTTAAVAITKAQMPSTCLISFPTKRHRTTFCIPVLILVRTVGPSSHLPV